MSSPQDIRQVSVGVKFSASGTQLQEAVDTAAGGKTFDATNLGAKLRGQFSVTQLKANLKEVSADKLDARVNANFSVAQMNRDLREKAKLLRPITVGVAFRMDSKSIATARTEFQKLENQLTDIQIKGLESRKVANNKARLERLGEAKKLAADITKIDARTTSKFAIEQARRVTSARDADNRIGVSRASSLGKIAALEAKYEQIRKTDAAKSIAAQALQQGNIEREQANSLRRQDLEQIKFRNKQLLSQQALNNKIIGLAASQDAKLARFGGGNGFVKFGDQLSRISGSLNGFDRTVSRVLRGALISTSVFSAGVVTALGAAGIAAETFFAKFQQVVVRSAATAASSKLSDELSKTGKNTHTFAQTFAADSKLIAATSQKVALETVGFDPTEIAGGIQTLVQAGQTLPEALKNIGSAAKFAQINGEDLGQSTQDLAAAMAAAGVNSKDTAKFLDQVQLASQNAIGGAGDFLQSLANGASASARAFGETNVQAEAFTELLANTGQTGKVAGTQAAIVFRDFNKVIGQSQAKLKAAGVDTSTFSGAVTGIAKAFDEVKKKGGNVTAFSKDLGFTQRSLNSILKIVPQLQQLGPKGFDNIVKQLQDANGIVTQQSKVAVETVSGQFDQLGDTIKSLGQNFGQAAAGPSTKLLNTFAGQKSLLTKLNPLVEGYGRAFGSVITRLVTFVHSDDFVKGLKILQDAVTITVKGVIDAFREFSSAFSTVQDGDSIFVAFAKSVRAFATFSAATLPKVAKIIGEIINFLIDHKDAFSTFAEGAVVVLALKKVFDIFLSPILAVTKGLLAMRTALTAVAAAEEAGVFAKGLTGIAAAFGLIDVKALSAAKSLRAAAAAAEAENFALIGPGLGFKAIKAGGAAEGGAIAAKGLGAGAAGAGAAELGGAEASAAAAGFAELAPAVTASSGALAGLIALAPETLGATALVAGGLLATKLAFDHLYSSTKQAAGEAKIYNDLAKFNSAPDSAAATNAATDSTAAYDSLAEALDKAEKHNLLYATSAAESSRQNQIATNITNLNNASIRQSAYQSALAASGFDQVAESTQGVIGQNRTLAGVVGGFAPAFASLKNQGINAIGAIGAATQTTTAQLLNMQAVLQQGLGQQKKAFESQALANAETIFARARTSGNTAFIAKAGAALHGLRLDAYNNQLIAQARKQQRDAKTIAAATGTNTTPTPTPTPTTAAQAPSAVSLLPDLSDEAQARVDALKAQQRAKITTTLISKIAKGGGDAFKATRFEVKLLETALPDLDKAIASQQKRVDALGTSIGDLDNKLSALKDTQIAGSKAFDDQTFALDQQTKQLQLNRINTIQAGNAEDSPAVKAIDAQIAALQTASDKLQLQESLTLDPQKRKLDQLENPTTEAPLASIISQFNQLTTQRAAAQAQQDAANKVLAAQQAQQASLNAVVTAGNAQFEVQDRITRRAAEAADKLTAASAAAAPAITEVGSASTKASKGVNAYTDSIAGLDDGGASVQKAADSIAGKVKDLTPALRRAGAAVATSFNAGISIGATQVLYPGVAGVIQKTVGQFGGLRPVIEPAGEQLMLGFFDGMAKVSGILRDGSSTFGKGTIAEYLHITIPNWIKANKGPVDYDRTILVPAGEAVMDGFGKGLRTGFGQIQGFVRSVGPSLSEFVTQDAFSGRVATVMADIAVGKTPDINSLFSDLAPSAVDVGSFAGVLDPTLAFLHKTLSLADTTQMGQQLAKLFSLQNPSSVQLDSGGHAPNSYHYKGQAVDLSGSTAGMNRLFAALSSFATGPNRIIEELIHNHSAYFGGTKTGYAPNDHFNHDHIAFLAAAGFSKGSGKIGVNSPLVQGPAAPISIPGASPIVSSAIATAALRYKLPVALLAALTKQESGFRPNVISPDHGYGLTQLTSSNLLKQADALGGRLNPLANELVGAKYLHDLIAQLGSIPLGLSAYNSGPGGGETHGRIDVPHYVNSVLAMFAQFQKQFGGAREAGGPINPNKTYLVGERGPELVVPRSAGTVIPAGQTSQMLGGSGQQITYAPNINVQTNSNDPRVTADLIDIYNRRALQGIQR